LKPSSQDENITSRIKQACVIMDIKLLDHIILGDEGYYYSFSDEGML
jgi:DNA repair protein RadC